MSQQPHRVRTWAPRGCTPVLQHHFNWKKFSVVAGLTLWNFYFQLFDGAIKSPQVIEFLRHLLRHLSGRLLIVWDGAGSTAVGRSVTSSARWASASTWNTYPPTRRN